MEFNDNDCKKIYELIKKEGFVRFNKMRKELKFRHQEILDRHIKHLEEENKIVKVRIGEVVGYILTENTLQSKLERADVYPELIHIDD